MIIIAGLGNPGDKYKDTRHNIGFTALDMISECYSFSWSNKTKFKAEIASGESSFGKILLCKPNTFMNLSGESILPLLSFYKTKPESLIVLHDDIDLPFGTLKYKLAGSHGGHNGLRSIDSKIGTNYHRIRIGIGRPDNPGHEVSDFVLGKFSSEEEDFLKKILAQLIDIMPLLYSDNIEKFKNELSKLSL